MSCPLCSQQLTYSLVHEMDKGCGACQRQLKQMLSGFRGMSVNAEPNKKVKGDAAGYTEWLNKLEETDADTVNLQDQSDASHLLGDIRNMKRLAGMPNFLPLEKQVYQAWVNEGVRDEKIQYILGLSYSQLFHVKSVIRTRLQKQMAYYREIKRLEKEKING